MEENIVKSAVKISKKGIQLSWWLIVLAIVVFGLVFTSISLNKKSTQKAKVDTAQDIRVKQTISSLRGDVSRYFATKKTYVGWQPTGAYQARIKSANTSVKTKLTKDTYMIYAKLPNSKLYFCMDNSNKTGFTGEVKSIPWFSKTCK